MKRLALIYIILHLALSLFGENNKDDAKYVVTFYAKYSEFHHNCPSFIKIDNHLCLDPDLNSNYCNPGEFSFQTQGESKAICNIPADITKCLIRLGTYISNYNNNITGINNPVTYINTIIPIKPCDSLLIATGYMQGRISNSSLYQLFKIDYYIDIKPQITYEIDKSPAEDDVLLYDDVICIQATKGFPKDVYKWRYSYLDYEGTPRTGTLKPSNILDNGAKIYVKGSDFLTKTQFNELVETQNGITINIDKTKPVSSNKRYLYARPKAPHITDVTINKPICAKDSATINIEFSREILENEKIVIQYLSLNSSYRFEEQLTSKGLKIHRSTNLELGTWEVKIFHAKYKNNKGEYVNSHSAGEGMQKKVSITAPDPVTINNISQTTTSCIGRADGAISCEVNGGTGEKTCSLYSSDNKFISHGTFMDGKFLFTGLSKGSYYIEATDKNGCISERSNSIEILEPEPLNIKVNDITDLRCYGDSVGIVYFSFSGGTGHKTIILEDEEHKFLKDYKQSGNMEDDTICIFNDLSAGTYFLSATDEKGCVTNSDTEFEISEPDSLWLELTTTDATIFGNCNGTLSASFGGGTDSYTIKYLENENTYIWPQENIELSKYLCAGESEVTLIDGNNCTTTKKYIINQPDPLAAKVIQIDSIKCFGESTASLIVDSIKGGIPPYRVFWYNDNFSSEDYEIKDLSAEEYNLLVKDSAGASFELSTTIDQPKKIELYSTDIKPVFCSGDSTGSISLIAEGGTLPYKFFLEEALSTSGEYVNLSAGIYTARAEDNNNCFTEGLFTIETLSTLTAKISAESPKCDYLNDGFIDLSVEDGLEPYKITWYAEDKVLMEDIFKMSELSAGEYSVIVQDAAGCVEKVDTTLYKPEEFNIELPETLYLCIDQTYPITLENSRIDSAVWYFKDKEYSKSLKTRLRKEGLYNLDIAYDKYCHEYKTIKVDTINKSVKANFLVAEEIPVHDDAHLINITSKEDYDYVEWVYPENDAWVYGEDEYSFQLVFLNEGTYQVGMISHKDKCEASLFKTIKTFTPKEGITIEENSYNITRFSIDKSPNNGTFTTHIELSAKADVILYLYNASTGHVIASEQDKNNKTYNIPFSVNTPAGEYILLLIVPEWEKSSWIKMLII